MTSLTLGLNAPAVNVNGKAKLTYYEKVRKYARGEYTFPVPPVHTSYWTKDDWIRYIDNKGKWT
jgi:hypothetical protein